MTQSQSQSQPYNEPHVSTLDGMIAHLQTIRTAIGYDVDLYVMNSTYHTYEIRQVARDINDRYVLIRTEM